MLRPIAPRRSVSAGLLCVAVLVIVLGVQVSAHKPLAILGLAHPGAASALEVKNPDASQVVYTELTPAASTFWLTLPGAAGDPLYLSLGLPAIERLRAYRPALALVGPGLPVASVPFPLPEGTGALVLAPQGESRFFHEPFTGTDSWILVEEEVPLPASGTYYVVAYSPTGEYGKLWVAVGTREDFGLRDVLALPATAREVRAFHGLSGLPAWLEALRLASLFLFTLGSYALLAK